MYRSLFLLLVGVFPALAQTSVNMVGANYSAPAAFEVAPGQVVTLYFKGVQLANGLLRIARATTADLPTTLAGLSAVIQQGTQSLSVPLFAVAQDNQCGDVQPMHPGCVLTAVRMQIPFELGLTPASDGAVPMARLVIMADGESSDPFLLQPVSVSSHVVTTCDLDSTVKVQSCDRVAFHSDGIRVDAAAPAKPGEVITVYAFGLGQTYPSVPTGKPSPVAADVGGSGVLRVWTTIRNEPLNASPTAPRYYSVEAMTHPNGANLRFAGLAPGFVGLYQINIEVPSSFQPIMPCGADIRANAVMLVNTKQGSEVVPFCVQP
jgi:uncharacterized protein (TIGR03437 family)